MQTCSVIMKPLFEHSIKQAVQATWALQFLLTLFKSEMCREPVRWLLRLNPLQTPMSAPTALCKKEQEQKCLKCNIKMCWHSQISIVLLSWTPAAP